MLVEIFPLVPSWAIRCLAQKALWYSKKVVRKIRKVARRFSSHTEKCVQSNV
jgi:hypothetical protein